MAISNNQSSLYFSTEEKMIGIASLADGKIYRLLGTGNNIIREIAVSVSKEVDKVFFASDNMLATCFSPESLSLHSSHGGVNSRTKIPLRHKSAILKVIAGSKRLRKVVSISADSRIAIWDKNEQGTYYPEAEIFIGSAITSARYSETTGYIVLTLSQSAIVYDMISRKEMIRVTHDLPLKDALLVSNKDDNSKSILYSWSTDGTVSGWKIMGRNGMFFTHATEPLFKTHATIFPERILNTTGNVIGIVNYTSVMESDSITGESLKKYHTRHREAIVDMCIVKTAGVTDFGTLFATKTSLFLNDKCLSYGGSLSDSMQIEKCKQDPTGSCIGYSGVETAFSNLTSLIQEDTQFQGVLTLLKVNSTRVGRICKIQHDNARIKFWEFLYDGKYVATIASDNIIRIFDVYGQNQGHQAYLKAVQSGDLVCCFPVQNTITSFSVSSKEYVIFLGDDTGQLTSFQLEINQ